MTLSDDGRVPLLVRVHASPGSSDVVVELAGEIDQLNAGEIVDATQPWIRSGVASVTLDMAGVVFIDSGGIGRVIHLWKQARALGLAFRLLVAHEAVLALLELAGLARFMDVTVVDPRDPEPAEGR